MLPGIAARIIDQENSSLIESAAWNAAPFLTSGLIKQDVNRRGKFLAVFHLSSVSAAT
jgi:hypothetical protein